LSYASCYVSIPRKSQDPLIAGTREPLNEKCGI